MHKITVVVLVEGSEETAGEVSDNIQSLLRDLNVESVTVEEE
jgi:hypothetical protein